MRKIIGWMLVLALILCAAAAGAEGPVMAGLDLEESHHDWDNNTFLRKMEERTGVQFTYKQYNNASEYTVWKRSLAKPGAELPDILFKAALTDEDTLSLYEQGVLIDLAPLLEENAPNLWALLQEHPDWQASLRLPDGAIAALPLIDPLQSNNLIWINKRWLTMTRQEMPTTAEELTEVLRVFKAQDPNRNSRGDEVPMTFTGMWDLRFLQHAFGLVLNDYGLSADENGTVTCGLTGEQNRQFLTWLHQLWEEELIDRMGFSTSDKMRQITDSNADIPYGIVFGPSILQLLPGSAMEDYAVLPPLSWEGKQVYRSFQGSLTRGTFAITRACADPAAMLRWVDFLYTEEGCYLSHSGVLDDDYEVHADGSWSWLYSAEDVMGVVMTEDTIADGGAIPGYVPPSYQLSFDDESTHRQIESMAAVAEIAREAVPSAYLTAEESARLASLWAPIMEYAETQMTWFVTGDAALTDETWNTFCAKLDELGMPEVVAVWQQVMDRRGGN